MPDILTFCVPLDEGATETLLPNEHHRVCALGFDSYGGWWDFYVLVVVV